MRSVCEWAVSGACPLSCSMADLNLSPNELSSSATKVLVNQ
jgi:hypothetical protein